MVIYRHHAFAVEAKQRALPEKGDAVKALDKGIRDGTYRWRLVTFRTSAQPSAAPCP